MRPLSSDLREFIHLLNTNSVKYVAVGARALAFHGRPHPPRLAADRYFVAVPTTDPIKIERGKTSAKMAQV